MGRHQPRHLPAPLALTVRTPLIHSNTGEIKSFVPVWRFLMNLRSIRDAGTPNTWISVPENATPYVLNLLILWIAKTTVSLFFQWFFVGLCIKLITKEHL